MEFTAMIDHSIRRGIASALTVVLLAAVLLSAAAAGPVAAAPAAAAPAAAETGDQRRALDRGFFFGFKYQANQLDRDLTLPADELQQVGISDVGYGAVLVLGYSLTEHVSLRSQFSAAIHSAERTDGRAVHSGITFEVLYRFLSDARFHPYVFGGVGGAHVATDVAGDRLMLFGTSGLFGAGILQEITSHLLVDIEARLDMINWRRFWKTTDVESNTSSDEVRPVEAGDGAGKLTIGLVVHF
jgi:hypothetical protein